MRLATAPRWATTARSWGVLLCHRHPIACRAMFCLAGLAGRRRPALLAALHGVSFPGVAHPAAHTPFCCPATTCTGGDPLRESTCFGARGRPCSRSAAHFSTRARGKRTTPPIRNAGRWDPSPSGRPSSGRRRRSLRPHPRWRRSSPSKKPCRALGLGQARLNPLTPSRTPGTTRSFHT
jgi:hypothetical protein